jgi:alpha-mannosidase
MCFFAGLRGSVIPHCLMASVWLCGPALGGGENAAQTLARKTPPSRDLSKPANKALYCVGYAHLDTQWRWDFVKTIDDFIRSTLDDNFARFEQYPDYVFSFTGSVRYEMMKEYYPKRYKRLKKYIADGRWFVSGSSVDEGDVNVPSPESIIRQVLYGNLFFRREFGKQSTDFMLPDCFGFPASMPSIWAHCGLLGFSTQKLTWGSAVGIPFPVGVWEGPDGHGVIAALDPGPYSRAIQGRVDQNTHWVERVNQNGRMYGIWADYHYYGVGDQGGAPRESDVRNYVASRSAGDREMDIVLASSEQLFHDITPELRAKLPRYKGDMLLTEHSAGTLTSQSYMKRWNRQAEQLADAAERAAAGAWWLRRAEYPRHKLERAWVRILANQMHDILPGTSIPRAYRYSWNDDVVALNQFAQVLTDAVGAASSELDTQVQGTPLVVFNPLAMDRTDAVEATVWGGPAAAVRVFDPEGREVPSQILERDGDAFRLLFLAEVPANGFAVFDVRPSNTAFDDGQGPRVGERLVENESYRVTFTEAGDIEGVLDRRADRQLLSEPASLVFTYERPRSYPAWNMDWADRRNPPVGRVDGPPQWRVVENGPVRAALAVTRRARNSQFTQVIRLTRDDPGRIVEVSATIDWQSTQCALKASFPLTVSNPQATYNWGMGTIARRNNDPDKFEVPSHEWFDLTDASGRYGVSLLEDSKFGSDKPADNEVRLTLLYTPGVRRSFLDQHSQDWGIHEIRYGLYGHEGDWRSARSEWRGRRFNQPLRPFVVDKHAGPLGRAFSFARTSTPQIDIRAIKLAEQRDALIVRVQELWGRRADAVALEWPAAIKGVDEVDGQERLLRKLEAHGRRLTFDIEPYGLRSFAIELAAPPHKPSGPKTGTPIVLPFDTDVASRDSDRGDGAMDGKNRSYPGELLPATLTDGGVTFELGTTRPGQRQAVTCRGQRLELGDAAGNQVHLLAAATEDVRATFQIGQRRHPLGVQAWTGFIGQWYDRVWNRTFGEVDYRCAGEVVAILPGFIKRDPVAWFSTHRHHPVHGNEAYRFAYIFHYVLPRPDAGATTLTLPRDERVRVFAVSLAGGDAARPATPLYDLLDDAKPIRVRHDYAVDEKTVFADRQPGAEVRGYRLHRFDERPVGPPRDDDDVDASTGKDFAFIVQAPRKGLEISPGSGAIDGRLVRLNDGEVAQNNDDTGRCVWYNNEGRFTLDLKASRWLQHIDTYSWHRSNRAPQYFSVWGSAADRPPEVGFRAGDHTEWELVAVVDTRRLGEGRIHATRIEKPGTQFGPYRHLLWICEDVGEGTFFTEIDIEFSEPTP